MQPAPQIALIAVTQKGVERAQPAPEAQDWRGIPVCALWTCHGGLDRPYDTALAPQVAGWFAHMTIWFFLATGAVTRLIAPCLTREETDPGS
jgi:hypothetical protein